jgi:hypothetical protein
MKLREASHGLNGQHLTQQDAEIATLKAQLAQALARITQLEQQLAAARKDSSTSSQPPSSDMVKPPKPPLKDGKKRKRGGQPGHAQHLRPIFPPEAINHFEPYTLDCCPDCGGSLRLAKRPPDVLQQVDGDCHLRPAGPFGLHIDSGLGTCSFRRRFAALAPAVRPLTAFFLPLFLRYFCSSAFALRHTVNTYLTSNSY